MQKRSTKENPTAPPAENQIASQIEEFLLTSIDKNPILECLHSGQPQQQTQLEKLSATHSQSSLSFTSSSSWNASSSALTSLATTKAHGSDCKNRSSSFSGKVGSIIEALTTLTPKTPTFPQAPTPWSNIVQDCVRRAAQPPKDSLKIKGLPTFKYQISKQREAIDKAEAQYQQAIDASQEKVAKQQWTFIHKHWHKVNQLYVKQLKSEFDLEKAKEVRKKQEELLRESELLTNQLAESFKQQINNNTSQKQQDHDDVEEGGNKNDDDTPSFLPKLLSQAVTVATKTNTTGSPAECSLQLLNTLNGQRPLRHYQREALEWMINLYENGLNGILADEMGLGKTVQTLALFAYFAEYKQDWGPHLIVVPTAVIINWEMECKRWCPGFKILTYFGSQKARNQLRQGWTSEDAFDICITSYNIVMNDRAVFRRRTWGFLVLDEAHQIKNWASQKWQGLFDFQAQHRLLLTGTPLQNSVMELWALFHFLMPSAVQFESNDEFRDWYSNPMNEMVSGKLAVSEVLVQRLHALFRPFLLRRLKKDVEKELPSKTEKIILCRLSRRQRELYDEFTSRKETQAKLSSGSYTGVFGILLSLRKVCNHPDLFAPRPILSPLCIMEDAPIGILVPREVLILHNDDNFLDGQWIRGKKNRERNWGGRNGDKMNFFQGEEMGEFQHDFEKCVYVSSGSADRRALSFWTAEHSQLEGVLPLAAQRLVVEVQANVKEKGSLLMTEEEEEQLGQTKSRGKSKTKEEEEKKKKSGKKPTITSKLFHFLRHQRDCHQHEVRKSQETQQDFLRERAQRQRLQLECASMFYLPYRRAVSICGLKNNGHGHHYNTADQHHVCHQFLRKNFKNASFSPSLSSTHAQQKRSSLVSRGGRKDGDGEMIKKESTYSSCCIEISPSEKLLPRFWDQSSFLLRALIPSIEQRVEIIEPILQRFCCCYIPKVTCVLRPTLYCHSKVSHFQPFRNSVAKRQLAELIAFLRGRKCSAPFPPGRSVLLSSKNDDDDEIREEGNISGEGGGAESWSGNDWMSHSVFPSFLDREKQSHAHRHTESYFLREIWPVTRQKYINFPDRRLLIHDCGKFQVLQHFLPKLRQEGHRALIFTQFSLMLDTLEKFLALLGFSYLRLDGSTKIEDRQRYVERFNHDERIGFMILSTRAGGIGVNLIGADTVIFYDSDWNPAMDLQAQDRCHRIGQTRSVTIYRLISENTVEEKILEKARQRKMLNNVVIRGGQFHEAPGNTASNNKNGRASFPSAMQFSVLDFFHDYDEDTSVERIQAEKLQSAGAATETSTLEEEPSRRRAEKEKEMRCGGKTKSSSGEGDDGEKDVVLKNAEIEFAMREVEDQEDQKAADALEKEIQEQQDEEVEFNREIAATSTSTTTLNQEEGKDEGAPAFVLGQKRKHGSGFFIHSDEGENDPEEQGERSLDHPKKRKKTECITTVEDVLMQISNEHWHQHRKAPVGASSNHCQEARLFTSEKTTGGETFSSSATAAPRGSFGVGLSSLKQRQKLEIESKFHSPMEKLTLRVFPVFHYQSSKVAYRTLKREYGMENPPPFEL